MGDDEKGTFWQTDTEEYVAINGDDIQFINVSGIFHSALPTASNRDFMTPETRFLLSQWGQEMFDGLQKAADKSKSDTKTVFFKITARWFLEDNIPKDVECEYEVINGMSLFQTSDA